MYQNFLITHLIVETLLNPYARCVPQLPYPLSAAQLNTVEGASLRHALLLFFFRKWIKNAGKNHALINRNYVRSRGRALPPSACLPGRTPAASRGILAAT